MRPIRRVLVVHPYGIGDLIFTTPILRALRLMPGMVCVDLLLGSRTKVMIETNPHVDEIFSIDRDVWRGRSKLENLKEMIRLGRIFREKKYDLLIDFSMRREYAFFGQFFLGIPIRAGFNYKNRASFHNRRLEVSNGFEGRHVSLYYSQLASLAGVPVENKHLELYLSESDQQFARDYYDQRINLKQNDVVVLAPGGGESWGKDASLKRWPVEHFERLAKKMISEKKNLFFLIVGSPAEKDLALKLEGGLKDQSLSVAGAFTVMQVAALIKQAKLFVGNDGGLMHMAHALRVPTVSFFGPTDPNVYGPYPPNERALVVRANNNPCYKKFRYDSNDVSIQSISVEQAWTALSKSFLFEESYKEKII